MWRWKGRMGKLNQKGIQMMRKCLENVEHRVERVRVTYLSPAH